MAKASHEPIFDRCTLWLKHNQVHASQLAPRGRNAPAIKHIFQGRVEGDGTVQIKGSFTSRQTVDPAYSDILDFQVVWNELSL